MSVPLAPSLQAMTVLLKALRQAPFYQDYVVRGSFVSRQWMKPWSRECKDLDLLYLRDYVPEQLIAHVRQLVRTTSDKVTDGVLFEADTMTHQAIWENSISPGIRFDIAYLIADERHRLQLDIACNDPLVSDPVEQMIEGVVVQTVPLETLAAWKLHGLFEHLNGPWQSKTLWDLYVFCHYNRLDENLFVRATALAFSSRFDPLEIVGRLLAGDFGRSKKSRQHWQKAFSDFTSAPFVELPVVLDWLADYLNPLFGDHCTQTLASQTFSTQADVIRYRVSQLRLLMNSHPRVARQKLKTLSQKRRILPYKAYNTIHHLPSSRLGIAERCLSASQSALLTDPTQYHSGHVVIVQEKLDGSCVCAYRKNGELFALGRAGDLADESPNESRRLWAAWVAEHAARFMAVLKDGERLCGEWLAMVHGTHYDLPHEPFVAFDLFTAANTSVSYQTFCERCAVAEFVTPHVIHQGAPYPLEQALEKLGSGHHGSTEPPEGLIWRLERAGKPAFKAKYVRHDKVDGCYLTENTGEPEQWNSGIFEKWNIDRKPS